MVQVVAAVLYKNKKVLIVRRGPAMSGAGHWEFPGGKIEAGESEIEALEREIYEELRLHIKAGEFLGENVHQYPAKKICLRFYLTPMTNEEIVLTEHDAFLWVAPDELSQHALSAADIPIIDALKRHAHFQ